MVFLELHINFDYSPKEKVFIYERSKKLEKILNRDLFPIVYRTFKIKNYKTYKN